MSERPLDEWEAATRRAGRIRDYPRAEAYIRAICREMGIELPAEPLKRMPHAPGVREWERRQNEQKAALVAREPGEEG